MKAAHTYYGLRRGSDTQWSFIVGEHHLNAGGIGHGGAVGGAALVAIEATVERPVVWASLQFVRSVTGGQRVDIELTVDVHGHQMSQVSATANVDGQIVIRALAAAGRRPFERSAEPHAMPAVPAPGECPVLLDPAGQPRTEVADRRLALGRQPTDLGGVASKSNRTAIWCRLVDGPRLTDVRDMAICADFLATGISDVLGVPAGGNSIDNTLRVVGRDEADWLLAEVHVDHVGNGFAQAGARLWSPNGRLLALGAQTVVLRTLDAKGQPARVAAKE